MKIDYLIWKDKKIRGLKIEIDKEFFRYVPQGAR